MGTATARLFDELASLAMAGTRSAEVRAAVPGRVATGLFWRRPSLPGTPVDIRRSGRPPLRSGQRVVAATPPSSSRVSSVSPSCSGGRDDDRRRSSVPDPPQTPPVEDGTVLLRLVPLVLLVEIGSGRSVLAALQAAAARLPDHRTPQGGAWRPWPVSRPCCGLRRRSSGRCPASSPAPSAPRLIDRHGASAHRGRPAAERTARLARLARSPRA